MELNNCQQSSRIKNLKFGEYDHGVNIHEVDLSSPPQPYKKDESFYERNKTAINILAVLGVATIAVLAGKKILKNPSTKNAGGKASNPYRPISIGALSPEEFEKYKKFQADLANPLNSDKKKSRQLIEDFMKTDNLELKRIGFEHVIERGYVTFDNYDLVMDYILKLKPDEKRGSYTIDNLLSKTFKDLFGEISVKGEVRDNVLDDVIKKIQKNSGVIKACAYENLIVSTSRGYTTKPTMNEKQLKSVLEDLATFDGNEEFSIKSFNLVMKKIKVTDLKAKYARNMFLVKKLDDDYIRIFKDLINNKTLDDSSILSIIEDIKTKEYPGTLAKEFCMYEEILELLSKNKSNSYIASSTFTESKFRLFEDVLSYSGRRHKKFLDKEKFYNYYKNLMDLVDKNPYYNSLKENYDGYYIKRGRAGFMDARTDYFIDEFKRKANFENIDELESFIDESLNYFSDYIRKNASIKNSSLGNDYLKQSFEKFNKDIDNFFLFYVKDNASFKERMSEKIKNFGRDNFNMRYSRFNQQYSRNYNHNYQYGSNSNQYKHSYQNYQSYTKPVVDKKAESINDIVEFFKKEKVFDDEIELLQDSNLTLDNLKRIKKKFVVKYHPDRAGNTEEIFKKYFALFETLESLLGK